MKKSAGLPTAGALRPLAAKNSPMADVGPEYLTTPRASRNTSSDIWKISYLWRARARAVSAGRVKGEGSRAPGLVDDAHDEHALGGDAAQ
jgi:hypothetical protein